MSTFRNYYQASGGSLSAQAPTYVRRPADDKLFERLRNGEFCYVLTARQMGKSSLKVRTIDRLRTADWKCVDIDITSFFSKNISAEDWYYNFLNDIAETLDFEDQFMEWWDKHNRLTPVKRMVRFWEDLLLKTIESPIAIFIDEIDSLLSIKGSGFSPDDFFAALRAVYNRRSVVTELSRLHFCILGVAAPNDLMNDPARTPFNIGTAIPLRNLGAEDTEPLLPGLGKFTHPASNWMAAIMSWSGGQPYLTQALAEKVSRTAERAAEPQAFLDQLIQTNYLTSGNIESERNLANVQLRIREDALWQIPMLNTYREILLQGSIPVDLRKPEQVYLKLTGLVQEENGRLVVANRLYRHVFDETWLEGIWNSLQRPFASEQNKWEKLGRSEDALIKGEVLQQALAWAANRIDLSQQERDFLEASRIKQVREEQEALRIKEREKQRKNLTAALVAAVCLLIAAIGGSVVAFQQAHRATKQTKIAESAQARTEEALAQLQGRNAVIQEQRDSLIRAQDQLLQAIKEAETQTQIAIAEKQRVLKNQQAFKYMARAMEVQTQDPTYAINLVRESAKLTKEKASSLTVAGNLLSESKHYQQAIVLDYPLQEATFTDYDSRIAAFGKDRSEVLFFDRDGNLQEKLTGHSGYIKTMEEFSEHALFTTLDASGLISLWSSATRPYSLLSRHQHHLPVSSYTFYPTLGVVLFVDKAGILHSWKPSDSQSTPLQKLSFGKVRHSRFSPDSQALFIEEESGNFKLFLKTGTELRFQDQPISPNKRNQKVTISIFAPNDRGSTTLSLGLDNGEQLEYIIPIASTSSLPQSYSSAPGQYSTPQPSRIPSPSPPTSYTLPKSNPISRITGTTPGGTTNQSPISALASSRNGKLRAIGRKNGRIYLSRDRSVSDRELKVYTPDLAPVEHIAVNSRGSQVLGVVGNTIAIWDLNKDNTTLNRSIPLRANWPGYLNTGLQALALIPDTKQLIAGSRSGHLGWLNEQGQLLSLEQLNSSITEVAFSELSGQLAAGQSSGEVTLYQLAGSQLSKQGGIALTASRGDDLYYNWGDMIGQMQLSDPNPRYITKLAFAPTENALLAANLWGNIHMISLEAFDPIWVYEQDHPVFDFTTVEQGGEFQLLVADSNWVKRVYAGGEEPLLPSDGLISQLELSPDAKTLLVGHTDGSVSIFKGKDLQFGKKRSIQGHFSVIRSLQFTQDGQYFYSAAADGSVRLWNHEGQLFHAFEKEQDRSPRPAYSSARSPQLTDLVLSKDGRSIFLTDGQTPQIQQYHTIFGALMQPAFAKLNLSNLPNTVAQGVSARFATIDYSQEPGRATKNAWASLPKLLKQAREEEYPPNYPLLKEELARRLAKLGGASADRSQIAAIRKDLKAIHADHKVHFNTLEAAAALIDGDTMAVEAAHRNHQEPDYSFLKTFAELSKKYQLDSALANWRARFLTEAVLELAKEDDIASLDFCATYYDKYVFATLLQPSLAHYEQAADLYHACYKADGNPSYLDRMMEIVDRTVIHLEQQGQFISVIDLIRKRKSLLQQEQEVAYMISATLGYLQLENKEQVTQNIQLLFDQQYTYPEAKNRWRSSKVFGQELLKAIDRQSQNPAFKPELIDWAKDEIIAQLESSNNSINLIFGHRYFTDKGRFLKGVGQEIKSDPDLRFQERMKFFNKGYNMLEKAAKNGGESSRWNNITDHIKFSGYLLRQGDFHNLVAFCENELLKADSSANTRLYPNLAFGYLQLGELDKLRALYREWGPIKYPTNYVFEFLLVTGESWNKRMEGLTFFEAFALNLEFWDEFQGYNYGDYERPHIDYQIYKGYQILLQEVEKAGMVDAFQEGTKRIIEDLVSEYRYGPADDQQKIEEIQGLLRQIPDAFPKKAELYPPLVNAYLFSGQTDKAKAVMRKLKDLPFPGDWEDSLWGAIAKSIVWHYNDYLVEYHYDEEKQDWVSDGPNLAVEAAYQEGMQFLREEWIKSEDPFSLEDGGNFFTWDWDGYPKDPPVGLTLYVKAAQHRDPSTRLIQVKIPATTLSVTAALIQGGKYQEVIKVAKDAIALIPQGIENNGRLYPSLVNGHLLLGQWEEAQTIFQEFNDQSYPGSYPTYKDAFAGSIQYWQEKGIDCALFGKALKYLESR